MTLLVVMLTAMTAGAQSVINDVPYIDANGTEQTVTATVIDYGTGIYADGALALLKGELQTLQELPPLGDKGAWGCFAPPGYLEVTALRSYCCSTAQHELFHEKVLRFQY